jgi:CBS domain-containing protein
MKVAEIMSQPVVTIRENASLEDAARLMLDKNIGCLPVVDESGKLRGIVTESNFTAKEKGVPFSTFRAPQLLGQWMSDKNVEQIYDAARRIAIKEIMTAPVIFLQEDDRINKAVELMLKHNINRLPVLRGDVPVGIVARHDLLRLLCLPE